MGCSPWGHKRVGHDLQTKPHQQSKTRVWEGKLLHRGQAVFNVAFSHIFSIITNLYMIIL